MQTNSKYNTIKNESFGEFRDRGSKFLAYAYPIDSEEDTYIWIEHLKKEHPKARHWCYAWRLGLDKNNYRANDDGEPSGTAGRPILGQIDSAGLTNVLVVVVRYFGGTLLGTSGLINAYKEGAREALQNAQIIEKIVLTYIKIQFDYAIMSDVMNALKKLEINIIAKDFSDNATLKIGVPQDLVEENWEKFKASVLKLDAEQAALIKHIGGLKWELDQA
jgi:uncharacterized YigZ family protein